jgi:two-component system nitrate/nitrite response regulator NarL
MSHNPKAPCERTDTPIKVAVLSDDSLLAAALSSLLGQQGGVEVTALAQADVALWDPGADASRLQMKLAELSHLAPPTLALVPNSEQAPLALEAGARGVMLRDHVGPHLISALRAVQGGLTVLDTSLADNLLADTMVGRPLLAPQLKESLTAREREVVQLMAEGLSNKQIAGRLDISEHTAKFHIGRILEKLDSDTRTEAVVRALRHGLVSV